MSMSRCKDSKIAKDSVILYYGGGRFEVVSITDALKVLPAEFYDNKFLLSNSVAKTARQLNERDVPENVKVLYDAFIVLTESRKSYDSLCELAEQWGVI